MRKKLPLSRIGSNDEWRGEERKFASNEQTFFPPFFSSLPFPPPTSSSSEKRSHVCCRSGTNGLGTFSYGIVFHGWLLLMPNFRFIRRPRKGVRFCSPPVKAAGQLHANPCGFPRVIHHQTSIALSPFLYTPMRKHKIEEERKGAGWYSRRISRILVRRPLPWCFVPSTYLGVVVAVVVVVVVVGAPTLISCPPNLLDIVPIFLSAAEYLCALPSPLCRISPSPHPLSRPPPFLLSYPSVWRAPYWKSDRGGMYVTVWYARTVFTTEMLS